MTINLLIGIVSNRHPAWRFINSLMAMQSSLRAARVPFETHVESQCSLLSQGRQNILTMAMAENFTYLLMLDDDMTFPPHVVDQLLSHNLQAVGVDAPGRGNGVVSTAIGLDGEALPRGGGLIQVKRCGLSVFLLNLSAIRTICPPHFEIRWSAAHSRYAGEDTFFCTLLQYHGVKIHVDRGLSRHIGHIGEHVYGEVQ